MTDGILPLSGAPFGANPSFVDLLRDARPDALAHLRQTVTAEAVAGVPHGTTVLGLNFADGMLVAGDRRATAGYTIADDKMRKVFAADDYSRDRDRRGRRHGRRDGEALPARAGALREDHRATGCRWRARRTGSRR